MEEERGKKGYISYRHQILNGEVVTERRVPSVTPGLCVNGHAVLPLVLEQVPWQVAIGAGVVPAVLADGAVAPAVVCHHGVSYGAAEEERLMLVTGCCWDYVYHCNIYNAGGVFFLNVVREIIKNVHLWLAQRFRDYMR